MTKSRIDELAKISDAEDPQTYFQGDFRVLPPPPRRAAYSDRTAFVMASMAHLAYHKFEDVDKELELKKEEKDSSNNGNPNLYIVLFCPEETYISNVFITRGKKRNDRNNISCINHTVHGGLESFTEQLISHTRTAECVTCRYLIFQRRLTLFNDLFFEVLCGYRSESGTQ